MLIEGLAHFRDAEAPCRSLDKANAKPVFEIGKTPT
jgi:hypothetical protein